MKGFVFVGDSSSVQFDEDPEAETSSVLLPLRIPLPSGRRKGQITLGRALELARQHYAEHEAQRRAIYEREAAAYRRCSECPE